MRQRGKVGANRCRNLPINQPPTSQQHAMDHEHIVNFKHYKCVQQRLGDREQNNAQKTPKMAQNVQKKKRIGIIHCDTFRIVVEGAN